jgi:hypothetical protein
MLKIVMSNYSKVNDIYIIFLIKNNVQMPNFKVKNDFFWAGPST